MLKHSAEEKIYGIATVGEKGQVVIPSEAREMLGLKKGQKLLVFGMGHGMLACAKLSGLEEFATHMSKKLRMIKNIINKNK